MRTGSDVPGSRRHRPCLRSRGEARDRNAYRRTGAAGHGPEKDRGADLLHVLLQQRTGGQGRSGDALREAGSGSRRAGEDFRRKRPHV